MAAASDRGGGGGARPRHPADVERGKMSFSSGKKPHEMSTITKIIRSTLFRGFTGSRSVGVLRCIDVMSLIQDQLAILSGGRDRRGAAIITFPSSGRRDRAKPEDYRLLLQYLMSIPR